MDLSIIIVNYKTPKLTSDCIESIYKQTKSLKYEIIVVDNDSQDESHQVVKSKFPDIVWISMHENVGFGRANNVGINKSRAPYVLLLNSDTVILDNAIEKCFSYLTSIPDSNIVALGCKLMFEDRTIQLSSYLSSDWPGIINSLKRNFLFDRILRLSGYRRGKNLIQLEQMHEKAHETGAVSGAFVMIRKGIFDDNRIFDPDFFLYFEEIELFNRILKKGYSVFYFPDAEIIHYSKKSSKQSVSSQLYLSKFLFILKRYGVLGYFLYTLINYFNIFTNTILYPFLSINNKELYKEYLKEFFPIRRIYFKLPFKYSKRYGSGKKFLNEKNLCISFLSNICVVFWELSLL